MIEQQKKMRTAKQYIPHIKEAEYFKDLENSEIIENENPNLIGFEKMRIMSLCSNNIIANSSFSWWGAYFNSHADKIVCYPATWFGQTANNNTRDLCPSEWIKLDV